MFVHRKMTSLSISKMQTNTPVKENIISLPLGYWLFVFVSSKKVSCNEQNE
jgi:hypothetical protein